MTCLTNSGYSELAPKRNRLGSILATAHEIVMFVACSAKDFAIQGIQRKPDSGHCLYLAHGFEHGVGRLNEMYPFRLVSCSTAKSHCYRMRLDLVTAEAHVVEVVLHIEVDNQLTGWARLWNACVAELTGWSWWIFSNARMRVQFRVLGRFMALQTVSAGLVRLPGSQESTISNGMVRGRVLALIDDIVTGRADHLSAFQVRPQVIRNS
jgi:hypothetical protein